MGRHSLTCVVAAAAISLATGPARAQVVLPDGFSVTTIVSGLVEPVGIAFADDGRIFIAEKRGVVRVWDGTLLETPFIDLRDEVNGPWDRGLLGIALDPGFLGNRLVYLLYTVDPIPGEPDESPFVGTFSRLTRYAGTVASNGNVADPGSREVLIGATPAEGIPVCEPSHTIGSLRWGLDGSLFVSAGDGAHFDGADAGGLDPDCFGPGMFGPDEDIGAFRAQYLDSLAGKILRIDPGTGLGLPSNPYWTGDGADNRSRVWVSGVRNPYRFSVKPGPPGPGPGTLYVGDVGWYLVEEVSVVCGGENLGWPCREGFDAAPEYPNLHPDHSGCDSIQTPGNPGPLTDPVIDWHHFNPGASFPPGYTGSTAIGGVFYTGHCYPPFYRDMYFLADYSADWIKTLEVDAADGFIALHDFGTSAGGVVDLVAAPATGDLYYVSRAASEVRRIDFDTEVVGDLDGDCSVGILDFLGLLAAWGPCPEPCPPACVADLDGDCVVGILDFLMLLANWG